jgi:hypothetical protein
MYLLYLDESGNEKGAEDRHFVLAGVAAFERQTYFLEQALNQIQAARFPGLPPEPFHANAVRAGRGFWRKVPDATRDAVLDDIAKVIAQAPSGSLALFAAVVQKNEVLHGEKAVERATEEVCKRFDVFLKRKFQEQGDAQRGLLIFAEGRFHQRARLWVRGFRELGTRWGALHNVCDIPYFASPDDTRLLQIADFVAHAVYLLYERRDASLARTIFPRLDQKDGVLHGLAHVRTDTSTPCGCPACASRALPGSSGSWL